MLERHKTIVYTGDKKHPNQHKGAHSLARDGSELPFVFAKLALAPAFNGKQRLGEQLYKRR